MKNIILLFSSILFLLFFLNLQPKEKNIKYLALGDGYTIGESLKPENSWPNLLATKLEAENKIAVETKIIAKAGWEIENVMNHLKIHAKGKYDIVSIMIGINDYSSSNEILKFKLKFEKIIEMGLQPSKYGEKGLFVISLPDYSYSPKGQGNSKKIHNEILIFNEAIEAICLKNNILYIDINDVYKRTKGNQDYLAPNKIHPSKTMYDLWVNVIYKSLLDNKIID